MQVYIYIFIYINEDVGIKFSSDNALNMWWFSSKNGLNQTKPFQATQHRIWGHQSVFHVRLI